MVGVGRERREPEHRGEKSYRVSGAWSPTLLCGEDVYLRKITMFTQSFGLQPSGMELSVKAGLLINCGAW